MWTHKDCGHRLYFQAGLNGSGWRATFDKNGKSRDVSTIDGVFIQCEKCNRYLLAENTDKDAFREYMKSEKFLDFAEWVE